METTLACLSLIAALVLSIYSFTYRNNKFSLRGIEYQKPTIFFGNMLDVFLGKESEAATFENLYEKFSREK